MSSQGERGNVGAPPVPVPHARSGGPGDHRPGRALGASPRPRAQGGHHARRAAGAVAGSAREAKRPERGRGESSRRIVPVQVGNRDPRAPREGRQRRASRWAGGTSGSDAGLAHRRHATPEQGATGTTLSSDGVQQRVARARPRLPSRSLAADPQASCPGGRPGDGPAVC
jgi:hypothetical protein